MQSSRRPSTRVLIRRAPHIVAYWDERGAILENYRTSDRFRAPAALAAHLPDYRPSALARAVADLVRHSLLERSDRAPDALAEAFESWRSWDPAAGLLHFSSKDLPYTDAARARRALGARAKRQPRPAAVKRYPAAVRVALPAPHEDGEFPRVLLERRTWRRFSSRAVPLEALSTLLGLSSRVQHWVDLPGIGRLPLKTHPSGGAQHPLEVYVLARRVDGLAPGLYHYAADVHHLERLRK